MVISAALLRDSGGGSGLVTKLYSGLATAWTSGSSVRGISQARILKWAAISFSGGSSWFRDQTHVSCIAAGLLHCRQILYSRATGKGLSDSVLWVSHTHTHTHTCIYIYTLSFIYTYIHTHTRGGPCNPLQCSCLKHPLDRGAWQAAVHGVNKESDTTEVT